MKIITSLDFWELLMIFQNENKLKKNYIKPYES